MKIFPFLRIGDIAKSVILLNICILLFSCNKEEFNKEISPVPFLNDPSKVNTEQIRTEAKTYYELLKTAIIATNSNSIVIQNSSNENPLIEKLGKIEITDENNQSVSFFSLSESEQNNFLNDWILLQASDMSDKIKKNPEISSLIVKQNEVIQQALKEHKTLMTKGNSSQQRIINNAEFFKKIRENLSVNPEESQKANSPSKIMGILERKKIPTAIIKSKLQDYARPGDFLVTLPIHDHPWVYLNIKNKQLLGHTAIINNAVSVNDDDHKPFSISAHENGVIEEVIDYWSIRCYIMGLQKVSWKMKFSGLKIHFYKEITPVSDTDSFLDFAKSYMGCGYVKWYEFATAKLAAPTRFTCTTLIWWSAKHVYNIDLTSWWAPAVTPSGLFLDESTYIRAVVEE